MLQIAIRSLILAGCFGAVFSGCAFSKNKDKNRPAVVVGTLTDSDSLSEEELKIEVIEGYEIGKYDLQLSWPANKIVRVEVQRGADFIDSNGAHKIKYTVDDGGTENFIVTAYNSLGGFVYRKSYSIPIPDDLIVRTAMSLSANEEWNYHRIIFSPGVKVKLNGNDLTINAKEYVNFGADTEIISNDENQTMPNAEFMQGSQIKISAKKANGQLKVYLIGFDGLDGRSGSVLDSQSGFVDQYLPELKGVPGEAGASRSAPAKANDGYICTRRPTDGGPGKPGAKGTRGKDAGRGGDSGSFEMNVAEPDALTPAYVEVITKPGNPGKPGLGGDGRRGGEGGDPGASVDGCPTARRGPEGPRGPKGDDGAKGQKGEVGTIRAPGVDLRVRGSK